MNRRAFVRTSAAAVATAATGPLILGAADKAGTKTATVGTGASVYECDHVWGQLPSGFEWQTTHNVAVDSHDNLYVAQQGVGRKEDTVVVFDPAGKFVRSFGSDWHGGGHGLDIRKEGGEEFIYLANTGKSPKVVKTNLKGDIVWRKERPETAAYADPKTPYTPTNVAFTFGGGFVVADGYGSNYLHHFDAAGAFVKQTGGKGTGDGQFQTPHGVWTDDRKSGELVVCDRANARLQYFDAAAKFVRATPPGVVLFPANIDTHKTLMVVADLHARVTLLDQDGGVLCHLGDDPEWRKTVLDGFKIRTQPDKWPAGKFVHPHDACFDAAGNIFVAEWVSTGRLTKLTKVA